MVQKKQDDWSGIINYLNSISARISDIESQSKSSLNDANQSKIYFDRSTHKLKQDLKNLKKGVAAAAQIVKKQQDILKSFVKEFKGIGKNEQFERLKEKVEVWNPESFITRKELNKKLKI